MGADHLATDCTNRAIRHQPVERHGNCVRRQLQVIVQQQHSWGGSVLEGHVAAAQEANIRRETHHRRSVHVAVEVADLISRPGIDQHEFDIARIVGTQRSKRLQSDSKAVVRDHDDCERRLAVAGEIDWMAAEQRQQGSCLTAEQGLGLAFAYALLGRRHRSQTRRAADRNIVSEWVGRGAVAQRRLHGVMPGVVAEVDRCAWRASLSRAEG